MYSNVTLYYLNQMGIRPWIKRNDSSAVHEKGDTTKYDAIKLLVFISSRLSTKAQLLLQQMLAYINLCEQELSIIPVQEKDSLINYTSRIEQQAPAAILVLGLNKNQFLHDMNLNCLVLHSIDPEHLIANPAEKKNVFKHLNSIKLRLFPSS
jgi:hypothetical protein